MTTPNGTTAPANSNPKLGVDICDACGRPPTVVGPLSDEPETVGVCAYCAHDLERWDLLTNEVVPILREWYRACLDRGFPANEIEDVIDAALDRLHTEGKADLVRA